MDIIIFLIAQNDPQLAAAAEAHRTYIEMGEEKNQRVRVVGFSGVNGLDLIE